MKRTKIIKRVLSHAFDKEAKYFIGLENTEINIEDTPFQYYRNDRIQWNLPRLAAWYYTIKAILIVLTTKENKEDKVGWWMIGVWNSGAYGSSDTTYWWEGIYVSIKGWKWAVYWDSD